MGLIFMDCTNNNSIYHCIIEEDPSTTSKVIAEHRQVSHKATQQLMRSHEETLKEFGRAEFEMRLLQTKGGTQMETVNK
jgi:hypothetical protein